MNPTQVHFEKLSHEEMQQLLARGRRLRAEAVRESAGAAGRTISEAVQALLPAGRAPSRA